MCNIGAVTHWWFDITNKMPFELFLYMPLIGHMDWIGFGSAFRSSLWIGLDWVTDLMDWIGFRKLDPRPTLSQTNKRDKFVTSQPIRHVK